MKYILNAKNLFTIISLFCITIIYSCNSSVNKEDDKLGDHLNSASTNKPVYIEEEPFKFKNVQALISHFQNQWMPLDSLRAALYKKDPIRFKDSIKILSDQVFSISRDQRKLLFRYLMREEKNAMNFTGMKYLMDDRNIKILQLESLFNQFPDSLRNKPEGKMIEKHLAKRKNTETQKTFNTAALNFKLFNTDGKPVSLNAISSEYILLEFWASWCAPCRRDNLELVKIKNQIEEGGKISIVAISLDDNKANWVKASKEDNLNYPNITDLKAWESGIAKEFKIISIPYNVIIKKDGTIAGNNLTVEELLKFAKNL